MLTSLYPVITFFIAAIDSTTLTLQHQVGRHVLQADRSASVRDVCSLQKLKLQLFLVNGAVIILDLLLILLHDGLELLRDGLV